MTLLETSRPDGSPGGEVRLDLARLLAERVPGRPLESVFYTSPEVHDLDVSLVLARSWVFIGTEPEIPEPGDYVTVQVGRYSVIVVRDDEERVRAWHNVCRHRGARILDDARGSVGNIVCGYHQWSYDLEGSLVHAGKQPATFDPGCFGLRPVHVRSVAGLLYLCLAEEPPADFDAVADLVAPYVAPHQLGRAKVAAQVDLVEEANWKLVMENNRECYHCDAGHPELSCSFFPTYGYDAAEVPRRLWPAHERYLRAEADLVSTCDELGLPSALVEDLSGRTSAFRVAREPLDGAGESFTATGEAICSRLLGDLPTARLGRLSIHHQPNAWMHLLADHAVTFTALPLSAERTLVRTTWLVHEDAVEGEDYDLEQLTHVWNQTNLQDSALVHRAQLGVASPAYEPGPYAPSEYQVDAFCTWYVEQLRAGLGADDGAVVR